MDLGASMLDRLLALRPVDCDLHVAVPGTQVLVPYLDEYWADSVHMRDIDRIDLASYPPNAPLTLRPDWRGLGASWALDRFGARAGIVNVLYGPQAMFNAHMARAFCRAVNDWVANDVLPRDPRLTASIMVPLQNPDFAAEEIARCAANPRFVQVLVLVMAELPLGRPHHWPVWKAAERAGLPLGIHAGSMLRHAPTSAGFPSYLAEDYVAQAQAFEAALLSLVSEGVFNECPDLRVVLLESGVGWLPSFLWRADKTWRGVRPEVPWLRERPSDIIRRHVRLTVQPLDAPADAVGLTTLLEQLGSEDLLLFASDFPHGQFDGDEILPDAIPDAWLRRMAVDNPLATYKKLAAYQEALA
jgi:uncharacterized protein